MLRLHELTKMDITFWSQKLVKSAFNIRELIFRVKKSNTRFSFSLKNFEMGGLMTISIQLPCFSEIFDFFQVFSSQI